MNSRRLDGGCAILGPIPVIQPPQISWLPGMTGVLGSLSPTCCVPVTLTRPRKKENAWDSAGSVPNVVKSPVTTTTTGTDEALRIISIECDSDSTTFDSWV